MSRKKLTSNKRSFRKNDKVFLNENLIQPVDLTINDGINPEYVIQVDVKKKLIRPKGAIPGGVVITGPKDFTEKPLLE